MAVREKRAIPDWSKRFFTISEDIGVSLGAVFYNEDARAVAALASVQGINCEDPVFRHHEPARGDCVKCHHAHGDAHRLYLVPDFPEVVGSHSFSYGRTLSQLKSLGVRMALFEWTLIRLPGVKAFCMRESEGVKFGFDRPHPFRPTFKPHKLLAGPLVDYTPGTHPKDWGEEWCFEPVWLRVVGATGEEYSLKLDSVWETDSCRTNLTVLKFQEEFELIQTLQVATRPQV